MLRILVLVALLITAQAWGEIVPPDITVKQLDDAVAHATATLPEGEERTALLKTYTDTRAALASFDRDDLVQAITSF